MKDIPIIRFKAFTKYGTISFALYPEYIFRKMPLMDVYKVIDAVHLSQPEDYYIDTPIYRIDLCDDFLEIGRSCKGDTEKETKHIQRVIQAFEAAKYKYKRRLER